MNTKTRILLSSVLALGISTAVLADSGASNGRISFFGSFQSSTYASGESRDFSEITTAIRLRSAAGEDGLAYEIDLRSSAYPSSEGRDPRTRIYDAWAGTRTAGGRLALRAGQMWLQDLGALGSVAGAMAEYDFGRKSGFRAGAFAGIEPEHFDVGFVKDVKKGGAWLSFDGAANRRHILGYVLVKDSSLTERSVLTTTNYLPAGKKLFLYQMAEYDLEGPGGEGSGGLHYVFANARWTPARRFDFTATYHHGRSIDARTITQDILEGRPVDQKALDGYLFESIGGRATFHAMRNLRVWAGYAQDRNNADDQSFGRVSAGIWAGNIAGSGIDVTLTDHRSDRPGSNRDAWYASIGRGLGQRLYLSADYSTSLSVVRIVSGDTIIETRPRTKRYGVNGVWNTSRAISFILTLERLDDEQTSDDRGLIGITYRF
jgi:hypothetical protein